MVSVPVSPYCELARWTLDRHRIAYTEECHAPFLHRLATRRHRGGAIVPVLDIGTTSLTDARQIVDHYEHPRAPQQGAAKEAFDEFFDELGVAVRAWAYTYQLPQRRSTARSWMHRAPWHERQVVRAAYPLLAGIVRRSLKLSDDGIAAQRAVIDASLRRVAARLDDGHRYLFGDSLTPADLAFAALVAPAVLPAQYSGPLPSLDELPAPMRREVVEIRAHPAGRYALRLFREERHAAPAGASGPGAMAMD